MANSRVPVFELPISVPPPGSRNRVRALHDQLRDAIVEGRLQAGLLMPPTRALASSLNISRNTVIGAYERLLGEGYLTSRQGAGTFVARVLPRASQRAIAIPAPARDRRLNAFWRKPVAPWAQLPLQPAAKYRFRLGVPDRSHFPFEIWRRLSARALRSFAKGAQSELEIQGHGRLREAISRHVSLARAVSCQPDDVVVTSGAQQAFDLLARILVTPGKTVVAVEEPGYPASRSVFELAGAKIVPMPVDEEGMVVERLPSSTRIVCVTPSHQYPLGSVMSLQRRAALIEFARRHGAVIVEDDYDGEFRFGGGPLDALQTLDRNGCVFYVGTFSKCLFPEVRVGFIVAPEWARHSLVSAKLLTDFQSPAHSQETLASFIEEGHLASHVRKMRRVYDERRQLLFGKLEKDFSAWLRPLPYPAGLHLTALAKSREDEEHIVTVAAQQGVRIAPLRAFFLRRQTQTGIVFGYGGIDNASMLEALERLRRALTR